MDDIVCIDCEDDGSECPNCHGRTDAEIRNGWSAGTDPNHHRGARPMTKLAAVKQAAVKALEAYAEALNEQNLVEECWTVRGISDAIDRQPQDIQPDDTYGAEYHRGLGVFEESEATSVLRLLLAWERHMGGWEAPAWEAARKLIGQIDD